MVIVRVSYGYGSPGFSPDLTRPAMALARCGTVEVTRPNVIRGKNSSLRAGYGYG